MITKSVADAVRTAVTMRGDDVTGAAAMIASVKSVLEVLASILDRGVACVHEISSPSAANVVGFVADDGSVDALIRPLQPVLALDDAGPLPLPAHGSTATDVLAVAEAMTAADFAGRMVLADDFGDDLAAASGEFLAAGLRRVSGQVWLPTRRAEVVRAFDPTEVLRLTRSHGVRRHHQLRVTTNKKVRLARRQVHLLLLPAMTTRSVALLEGPHDLERYGAVAERRLMDSGTPPPTAYGMRMIAGGISGGGGKEQPHLRVHGRDHTILDHPLAKSDPSLRILRVLLHVLTRHPRQQFSRLLGGRPLSLARQFAHSQLGIRHEPVQLPLTGRRLLPVDLRLARLQIPLQARPQLLTQVLAVCLY